MKLVLSAMLIAMSVSAQAAESKLNAHVATPNILSGKGTKLRLAISAYEVRPTGPGELALNRWEKLEELNAEQRACFDRQLAALKSASATPLAKAYFAENPLHSMQIAFYDTTSPGAMPINNTYLRIEEVGERAGNAILSFHLRATGCDFVNEEAILQSLVKSDLDKRNARKVLETQIRDLEEIGALLGGDVKREAGAPAELRETHFKLTGSNKWIPYYIGQTPINGETKVQAK